MGFSVLTKENSMSGYSATLKDGREIYIPSWPVNVQLENLTNASKYLGPQHIISIAELDVRAVVLAIMNADDPAQTAQLIKHFVCQVRIAGSKITEDTLDSMFDSDLKSIAEIFAHVIHSQYSDFFDSGLVKEPSQDK